MQSIGAVLKQNPVKICSGETSKMSKTQATSSSSANSKKVAERIEKLFTKFAAFYGHVWRSQFKSEGFLEFAKKEWQEGLKSFSDEMLIKAIQHCRDFQEMPPTLPQLIGICRDMRKRQDFFRKTEKPVSATKSVMTRHISKCKEILIKNK